MGKVLHPTGKVMMPDNLSCEIHFSSGQPLLLLLLRSLPPPSKNMQRLGHSFMVDHGPVFDIQNCNNNKIIIRKYMNYPQAL